MKSTIFVVLFALAVFVAPSFAFWCYQETANVSTSCGGLSTGSYVCYGDCSEGYNSENYTNAFDGDWNTRWRLPAWLTAFINMTYFKPSGATASSLWQITNNNPLTKINETIPASCWNYNSTALIFRVINYNSLPVTWECYNGTDWSVLYNASGDSQTVYEEAMWWSKINTAPTVTSVTATPALPVTTDTLVGSATCTDPDAGDTITAYWNWYRNGTSFSSGNAVVINNTATNLANISAANTTKTETWTFGVFCGDGTANSSQTNSSTLTIQNTAPLTTTPTLTPSPAYKTSAAVTCNNGTTNDTDGDTTTFYYQWYLNGAVDVTTQTIANATYNKGDNLTCEIKANDGTANSTAYNSTTLTISNTAPIAGGYITPTNVSVPDNLTGFCNFTDVDGDTANFSYIWYKNDAINTTGTSDGNYAAATNINVNNITSPPFVDGEKWILSCRAYDGQVNSSWVNSTQATVNNNVPVTQFANITSSETDFYTTSTLIGWCNATDADGGNVYYLYKWFKNGALDTVGGLTPPYPQNSLVNIANFTGVHVRDDNMTFSCQVYDGADFGSWINSTNATIVDSAPVINSVQFVTTNLGTTHANQLRVNMTDVDGNGERESCSFGGVTNTTFVGDYCWLNISTTLIQSGNVTGNDSYGKNAVVFPISFELTNASYAENSSAHTLAIQYVKKVDTLFNYAVNVLKYAITHALSLGYTLISGGSFASDLSGSSNVNMTTVWSGDWLTEVFGTEIQDASKTTEAGRNAYTKILMNVTDNDTVNFTSVSLGTQCRATWTQNASSTDITTSGLTNYTFGCNKTNVITKTRSTYNITDLSVTVDSNSTGFMTVLTNNTDTLNYTDILVNITSLIPSNWTNTSFELYNVTLANGTTNSTNRTIQTTTPLTSERDIVVADCVGFTAYTKYCTYSTAVDLGAVVRTTYYYRSFVNDTNNLTKDFPIYYNIPIARFTNWAVKVAGSEAVNESSSSVNLSITSNASYVIVSVGTNHTNSSLEYGDHQFDIMWYYDVAHTGGSTGGGGGIQVIYIGNATFRIQPTSAEVLVNGGGSGSIEYVITNYGISPVHIRLTVTKFGDDPSSSWGKFMIGQNTLTQTDVLLAISETKVIKVITDVPLNTTDGRYRFNVHAETVDAPSPASYEVAFYTIVGEDLFAPVTSSLGDLLGTIINSLTGSITLAQPFMGITSIPIWIFLPIGGVGIYAAYALSAKGGARRRRV